MSALEGGESRAHGKVGGWGLTTPGGFDAGYSRLDALNACASDHHRVRWILDVPDTTPGDGYSEDPEFIEAQLRYITLRVTPGSTAKDLIWELSQLFPGLTATIQ